MWEVQEGADWSAADPALALQTGASSVCASGLSTHSYEMRMKPAGKASVVVAVTARSQNILEYILCLHLCARWRVYNCGC